MTPSWTLSDEEKPKGNGRLDDSYSRVVSKLDAVGARVERRLDKGPRPTGIGVSGA